MHEVFSNWFVAYSLWVQCNVMIAQLLYATFIYLQTTNVGHIFVFNKELKMCGTTFFETRLDSNHISIPNPMLTETQLDPKTLLKGRTA